METKAVKTIIIPCPFCDRSHEGEFEDELEKEIMICRDKVSPRKRGDIAAFTPDEFDKYTITVESMVPH